MPHKRNLIFLPIVFLMSFVLLISSFINTMVVPEISAATCTGVDVFPGDDLAALTQAHPENTTFCIKTGLHRTGNAKPKNGQRFIGELGAILSGARLLEPADAQIDGNGRYYWTGQIQEGFQHGDIVTGGNTRDLHPEELFVNDTTRFEHVGSYAELDASGEWYFDYDADTIYLFDDPATFETVETSVYEAAIAPFWWEYTDPSEYPDNVVIENLVIEKYATPAQFGAIGHQAHAVNASNGWEVRHTEIRYNHGCGLRIMQGSVYENNDIHHNGQIGLCGPSASVEGEETVIVRNNNIHHNLELDFNAGWEGGALKIAQGSTLFENNWVHHNQGFGIWFDVDNTDTTIRSNLSEYNELSGIFYELSYGPAEIYWNISRYNGQDIGPTDFGGGIEISSAAHTEVYENLLVDNRWGIFAHEDDREIDIVSYNVHDNIIRAEASDRWVHHIRMDPSSKATIDNNTYYAVNNWDNWLSSTGWPYPDEAFNTFDEWQALGFDVNGQNHGYDPDVELSLPPGAVAFQLSTYGPIDTTDPTVTITSPAADSVVSGTINFDVTASDNVDVDRVEFYIDDDLLATDSEAPFTTTIDTNQYMNSSYTLRARAYDAQDNFAEDSIDISILNLPPPIPGDIDNDGDVDIFDLSRLLADYGTSDPDSDLDGSGEVDIFDLSLLLANYGS